MHCEHSYNTLIIHFFLSLKQKSPTGIESPERPFHRYIHVVLPTDVLPHGYLRLFLLKIYCAPF